MSQSISESPNNCLTIPSTVYIAEHYMYSSSNNLLNLPLDYIGLLLALPPPITSTFLPLYAEPLSVPGQRYLPGWLSSITSPRQQGTSLAVHASLPQLQFWGSYFKVLLSTSALEACKLALLFMLPWKT